MKQRLIAGSASWLRSAIVALAVTAGPAAVAADTLPAYEKHGPNSAAHAAVRVLDTDRMPVMGRGNVPNPLGWGEKMLFRGPKGGTLRMYIAPPGTEGAPIHYHLFHEWAYNLEGDFTNNESTMPEEYSVEQRFREGAFMSRPPYSLHGGERGRMKWMASQVGASMIIMEEGDAVAESFTVDPSLRDKPQAGGGMKPDPNYKRVQHWATPRIIDTIDHMPWQPVPGVPGLNVKYLSDDPEHGFRVTMYFLEAHAARPAQFRPYTYAQALQLNFVIAGDLAIETRASESGAPEVMKLSRYYYFERPPTSILGLAANEPTQGGAVWLEATYAKGNKWTDTPTPIEAPAYLR